MPSAVAPEIKTRGLLIVLCSITSLNVFTESAASDRFIYVIFTSRCFSPSDLQSGNPARLQAQKFASAHALPWNRRVRLFVLSGHAVDYRRDLPYIKRFIKVKVKVKGHPWTGHEGPEGEKRYSSTLSLTSALWDGWLTPCLSRITPGKDPVPIV
jgi:hypothetical protein